MKRRLPLRSRAVLAAGIFSLLAPACPAVSLDGSGAVEIMVNEKSGGSSKTIKGPLRTTPGIAAGNLKVKGKAGAAAYSGEGTFQVGTSEHPFILRSKAKGENLQDSTAPSGHDGDSATVFSTAKLNETCLVEVFEVGRLKIKPRAKFTLTFDLDGKIIHEGDMSVASARAEVNFRRPDGFVIPFVSSDTDPAKFDGTPQHIKVATITGPFGEEVRFGLELRTVACVAKYKACKVEALVHDTLRCTGLTMEDSDGRRFEIPDLQSGTGIDYSRWLNQPEPGTGAGEFAFASDALAAEEDDGSLVVKVNRDGGSAGTASVVVRNLTAPAASADFVPFSTTLDFADGETQKSVHVKLIDDATQQDVSGTPRSFVFELVNTAGGTISATRNQTTLTLFDDDTSYAAPSAAAAAYTARINPNGAPGEIGLLSLKVDALGTATFSGVVRGKHFAGRCREEDLDFIGDPKTVNVAGLGEVKLRLLRFETQARLPRVLGEMTLPDSTVLPIRGTQLIPQGKGVRLTSKRGAYTLLLDRPAGVPPGAPLGSGFARVRVLTTGRVLIAGKLADGSPMSGGGTLTLLRDLPLLAPLTKTKGELSGVLHFRAVPGTSDLDGELRWLRPLSAKPGPFGAGFTTTLAATGARYQPPKTGESILPALTTTAGSAVFHAASPDLAAALDREVAIGASPKNTVAPSAPNAERLTIKLAGSTGLWSGSFLDAGRTVKFQGALLQRGSRAAGYFLGATQSGEVTLVPGTINM